MFIRWRLLEECETLNNSVISKEDLFKNNGIINPSDNKHAVDEVCGLHCLFCHSTILFIH